MVLWRISNHADLLGTGGLLVPGRWHTAGRPVVYLSEHPASALLETLVQLEVDEAHWPQSYQLLKVEAAAEAVFEEIAIVSLSTGWKLQKAETQLLGDDWLKRAKTPLMRVPSALTPETSNWILNPRHTDANQLRIVWAERYPYDGRLFHSKR